MIILLFNYELVFFESAEDSIFCTVFIATILNFTNNLLSD